MSYTSPTWKNGAAPALSAEILQELTDAVQSHDETLPEKADKPAAKTVLLPVAGWSSNSQTVSVAGMTASANIIVTAAPDSYMAYAEAGVHCTAQGAGTLTFACEDTPTEALTVNVLILG